MNYKTARSLISNGDLVFVCGSFNRPIQSLIMWSTNSLYTHCGIAFWVEINNIKRLMVVEAQGGTRRRVLNMSFYEGKDIDVISSPKNWDEYADIAVDNLGTIKYGWFDAIYSGFRSKLNNYGLSLPYLNINTGEICSEFIAKCLSFNNVNITPQELFSTLSKSGNKIKLEIRK